MSEEQEENTTSGQPRDDKGRFAPKNESDMNGQSHPRSSDYTKMNSYLAKQLGLTDKLPDFQIQYQPDELFKQLSFMADHSDTSTAPQSQQKGQLPQNQKVAPISPPQPKQTLPGTQQFTPNLDKDEFSVSYSIDPNDIFSQKSKQKE